jgi:hypothetical protein
MSSTSAVLSHWNTLLQNFQTSTKSFYTEVEDAISKREIPDIRMKRIFLNEGGFASPKREYLRVARKEFVFAVCGAPYGTGFFVSWWLIEAPGCFTDLVTTVPVLGPLLRALLYPMTFYRVDTAMMFQTATHSAVLEVIDSITSAQGIKELSETDRKPVMREFFSF